MLQQQREAATFTGREGIAAQLKHADEVASLKAQKRIAGSADERKRRSFMGFTAVR